MQYTIEDTFDVSAERYWEVFFSEEYNAALWPALDVDWTLLELDRQGEGKDLVIRRRARLVPRREVPKALQKLVSGTISYEEHNVYRASASAMETNTIPSFGADRIDNHGTYSVEPLGENKCKRVWKGVCKCKIPLIGGKVEDFLVGQVRESYGKATEFTRRWHAEHPE